jgi:hypothetical protein
VIEKLALIWINSYELYFRGKNALNMLSDNLDIDRLFMRLLVSSINSQVANKRLHLLTDNESFKIMRSNQAHEHKSNIQKQIVSFISNQINQFSTRNRLGFGPVADTVRKYQILYRAISFMLDLIRLSPKDDFHNFYIGKTSKYPD